MTNTKLADLCSMEELGCFIYSQAVVAERSAPLSTQLFVCMTSAYRAYALDGYFSDPAKQFFRFAQEVVAPKCGIVPIIRFVDDENAAFEALAEETRSHSHVIFPGNLVSLYYSSYYRERDWPHYFVVTGHDQAKGLFRILDNLHMDISGAGVEYVPFTMPEAILRSVLASYWQTYVGAGEKGLFTFSREQRFWLLRLDVGQDVLLDTVLSQIRDVLELAFKSQTASERGGRWVDQWHLAKIRDRVESSADTESIDQAIRTYLVDLNFASAHLNLVRHFCVLAGASDAASEAGRTADTVAKREQILRSRLFLKCLCGSQPGPTEWDELANALAACDLEKLKSHISALKTAIQGETTTSRG